MQIRLKSYEAIRANHCSSANSNPVNWEWLKRMESAGGMTLEVETEHLFSDQFNVGPIEGVTSRGLRIMIVDVAEIIDDARIGVRKCQYCFSQTTSESDVCEKCGESGYLKPIRIIACR